jgi:hypothetical protein
MDVRESWRRVRVFQASKACEVCGETFRPKLDQPETRWNEQKRCSISCVGVRIGSWNNSGYLVARKMCLNCGVEFSPWTDGDKTQGEKSWQRQECCSQSCAKTYKNPIHKDGAVEKLSATLRKIGHKPAQRGGNGKPLTVPQRRVLDLLGQNWEPEVVVRTGMKKGSGYPYVYKIDVGNEWLKIGIEVDGGSHLGKRKVIDQKKDVFLKLLGWTIYRVKNNDALAMCDSGISGDELLEHLRGRQ